MVAALRDVKRNENLGIDLFDAVDAGLQQRAEVCPVRRAPGDRIVAGRGTTGSL
jgi:hypothetical protein